MAVESNGADLGSCVLVTREQQQEDQQVTTTAAKHHRSASTHYRCHQHQLPCYCRHNIATYHHHLRQREERMPSRASIGEKREASADPHLVSCQIWRWPDLSTSAELKRLPVCRVKDPKQICCNPYHWSRLCKPGNYSTFIFILKVRPQV